MGRKKNIDGTGDGDDELPALPTQIAATTATAPAVIVAPTAPAVAPVPVAPPVAPAPVAPSLTVNALATLPGGDALANLQGAGCLAALSSGLPGALQGALPGLPGLPGLPPLQVNGLQVNGLSGALHGLAGPLPSGLPAGLAGALPGALQGLLGTTLPGGLGVVPGSLPGVPGAPNLGALNTAALLANPASMMLLAQNPAAANLLAAVGLGVPKAPAPPAPGPPPIDPADTMVDPDVQELCDHFHIEDRHAKRLNSLMKKRQDTFMEDLQRLYDVLERAREPAGLLTVKMREMEEGTFIGKQKPDERLKVMTKKFNLDDQAESKLADILARYDKERRDMYLQELDKHLEVSNRPSAMVMMLLRKLGDGKPLGRPGPPAPGSYLDNQERQRREKKDKDRDKDKDKDRDKDRDRDRDRDRKRSRSRSRDRKKSRSRDRRKKSRSKSRSRRR